MPFVMEADELITDRTRWRFFFWGGGDEGRDSEAFVYDNQGVN